MSKLSLRCILIVAAVCVSGCGGFRSASSPDSVYSNGSAEARALQVPPDLTDVSNAEQFILPGTPGAPITRNTLLPQFADVRFVRNGAQSWLEFDQAPEDIWQKVLGFLRKEKFLIEKTQPIAGTVVTQWRAAASVASGSALRSLVSADEAFTRVAFRIERIGSGARLFSRSQASSSEEATVANSVWPAASHDPERTSSLLLQLLTHLGVEEQKARGILSTDQANAVLDNATLQTTGAGSQLVLYQGYQPAFQSVLSALNALNYSINSSDDGVGRIEVVKSDIPLIIEMAPTHVSEVRLAVVNSDGKRLDTQSEMSFLSALLDQLV